MNLITLEKEGVSTVCNFILVTNAIKTRALMHLKFGLQNSMNCQVMAESISGDLSHCSSVFFNFQYFNSQGQLHSQGRNRLICKLIHLSVSDISLRIILITLAILTRLSLTINLKVTISHKVLPTFLQYLLLES